LLVSVNSVAASFAELAASFAEVVASLADAAASLADAAASLAIMDVFAIIFCIWLNTDIVASYTSFFIITESSL
jgi:uncharacterized membrane protein YqjE